MEIGMIMTFEVHEKIRHSLLNALCEDPPPGYAAASMAQLERADRYIFTRLGEYTRSGIRGAITSGLPLDGFMERILESHKYIMLLMPLARGSGSASSSSGAHKVEPPARRAAKPDRQTATIENLKRQVENLKRKGEQGGRPKKQKHVQQRAQQGQERSGPMPNELKGHLSSTSKGPICFPFNLKSGCTDAATGQRCRRGWHFCCHRECPDRESHSLTSCPRKR